MDWMKKILLAWMTLTWINMVKSQTDGFWSDWTAWEPTGLCSVTCGAGTQAYSRRRTCTPPQFGGRPCQGSSTESTIRLCNSPNCPVNGVWRNWGLWDDPTCSVSCGGGTKTYTRRRTCTPPMFGGQSCVGNFEESRNEACNSQSCGPQELVNNATAIKGNTVILQVTLSQITSEGMWLHNGFYVSKSGRRNYIVNGLYHRLTITDVRDSDAGRYTYYSTQTTIGYLSVMPTGVLSQWGSWSNRICNATCGTSANGTRRRTRTCSGICSGALEETEQVECTLPPCPINGAYGPWTQWAPTRECSVTCGGGLRSYIRTRTCNRPAPQFGGRNCQGGDNESITRSCNSNNCPHIQPQQLQNNATTSRGSTVILQVTLSETTSQGAWYHGNNYIPNTGRMSYSVSGLNHRLTITNVQDSDAGRYVYYTSQVTSGFLSVMPSGNVLGPWGAWSYGQCSQTCGSLGFRTKRRIRTCTGTCSEVLQQTDSENCELTGCPGCTDAYTVYVVLDGSQSIGAANFNLIKSAIKLNINISLTQNSATKVGVVVFSSDVRSVISASSNIMSLGSQIDALIYPAEGSSTHLGIDRARDLLLEDVSGNARVMIVVTEGLSNEPNRTSASARQARNAGITIIAVAIYDTVSLAFPLLRQRSQQELISIASSSAHVFDVSTLGSYIRSLCNSTGNALSPWGAWSYGQCSQTCGSLGFRTKRRTRTCTGTCSEVLEQTDSEKCELSGCPGEPRQLQTNATAVRGSTAILQVTLSQEGSLGIWLHNGSHVQNSVRMTYSASGLHHRLTITDVRESDAGRYSYYNIEVTHGYLSVIEPGVLGPWGVWRDGQCNATCGTSAMRIRRRTRLCTGTCLEALEETLSINCGLSPCPVNGQWGSWSQWNNPPCSVTCGGGTKTYMRRRLCDRPAPQFGGTACFGDFERLRNEICNSSPCGITDQLQNNVTTTKGKTITLKVVLSQDVALGYWIHNNNRLSDSARTRYSVSGRTHQLTITNAQESDAGLYYYVSNGGTVQGYLTVLEEACKGPYTAYFVVDGSASIQQTNFDLMKTAIREFADQSIGNNSANKIGVVVFSDDVTSVIMASSNVVSLSQHILTLTHDQRGTATHSGIDRAKDLLLADTSGYQKIMIVMTDGISQSRNRTTASASEARRSGITIIALGILGVFRDFPSIYQRYIDELKAIGSSPSHVIELSKFSDLSNSTSLIVPKLCNSTRGEDRGLCDVVVRRNGVGYRYHPTDCDKYIQCYYNGNNVIGVYRSCPFGYYWNQVTFRCEEPWKVTCPVEKCNGSCRAGYKVAGSCRSYWECGERGSEAKCCPVGYSFVPGRGCRYNVNCDDLCPNPYSIRGMCDKRQKFGESLSSYEYFAGDRGWATYTCPSGTIFDTMDCDCREQTSGTCEASHLLTFDASSPSWLTSSNVSVMNGMAVFNVNSDMALDIKIRDRDYPIGLKIKYRESSTSSEWRVLASSSDCRKGNSFVLAIDDEGLHFQLKSWFDDVTMMSLSTSGMSVEEWKTVTIVYDGHRMTGMVESGHIRYMAEVNGQGIRRGYTQSAWAGVMECGLRIGDDGSSNTDTSFVGSVDMVSVYKCDPGFI